MTDNKDVARSDSEVAGQETSSACIGSQDWFLEVLVDQVNGTDNAIGMTLMIGGLLVSGDMVSGHKYFEGFAKEYVGALNIADSEVADRVKSSLSGPGQKYLQSRAEQESDTVVPPIPIAFVHLRNARIIHPGGPPVPANRAVWWRGLLKSVDGFVLGKLE